MIDELINLANNLDSRGLAKEADYLDILINKIAGSTAVRDLSLTWGGNTIGVGEAKYEVTVEKGPFDLPLEIHNITYNPPGEEAEEKIVVDAVAMGIRQTDDLPAHQITKLINDHNSNLKEI